MNKQKQTSSKATKKLALAKITQSCKIKQYCGLALLVVQQILFFTLLYIGDVLSYHENMHNIIMFILFISYFMIIPVICIFLALSALIEQRNFKQVYREPLPDPIQTRAIIVIVINLIPIILVLLLFPFDMLL